MKIILATIVKDEAARYWRSCLKAWSDFADSILVLDDASEDTTMQIAADFPKVENITPPRGLQIEKTRKSMWGAEGKFRKYLFDIAWNRAEIGDVIFWEDADMVPSTNPRELFAAFPDKDAFAFTLYDLWRYTDETYHFRHERPFWLAAENPRVWAVRKTAALADSLDAEWHRQDIHVGHLPSNWWHLPHPEPLFMPARYGILHAGYMTPKDRELKAERYAGIRHQLTDREWEHAATILDKEPALERLPFTPDYKIERFK